MPVAGGKHTSCPRPAQGPAAVVDPCIGADTLFWPFCCPFGSTSCSSSYDLICQHCGRSIMSVHPSMLIYGTLISIARFFLCVAMTDGQDSSDDVGCQLTSDMTRAACTVCVGIVGRAAWMHDPLIQCRPAGNASVFMQWAVDALVIFLKL
jgi:hypothetical protein